MTPFNDPATGAVTAPLWNSQGCYHHDSATSRVDRSGRVDRARLSAVPCTVYRIPCSPVPYHKCDGQPRESACPTELILGGTGQFAARPLARISPVPVSLDGPSPAWELTCRSAEGIPPSHQTVRLGDGSATAKYGKDTATRGETFSRWDELFGL
jgi:hypothetical protein